MDQLMEIEAIKQLKARYFRLMDQKRWDEWAELFTEDFIGIYDGPHPQLRYEGRDSFIRQNREGLADMITVHHGHMPEIQFTGSASATGIWAMFDYVERKGSGQAFQGYGHYADEYVKRDGHWKIKSTRLTRLRCDAQPARPPAEM